MGTPKTMGINEIRLHTFLSDQGVQVKNGSPPIKSNLICICNFSAPDSGSDIFHRLDLDPSKISGTGSGCVRATKMMQLAPALILLYIQEVLT